MFKDSRYFTIAGEFAKPIEGLIPEETKNLIKDKSFSHSKKDKSEKNKKEKVEKQEKTQEQKEIDELFEKLAQPQIEKVINQADDEKDDFDGYKENQTDNLDQLIEATVE